MKISLHSKFFSTILITLFCCAISYGQTVTMTYTAPSSVSVDGTVTSLPGVTFTAGDFPGAVTITDVDVAITWLKSPGTCTVPGNVGDPSNAQTSFDICGPTSAVTLASAGTWSGTTPPTAATTTTFSQGAAVPSGLPASGIFGPNGGDLGDFDGLDPVGTWILKAGDSGAGQPLCIASYTVTITVAPLPVELVNFTASKKEKTILLNWETASEINNKGFEIQRSDNGRDWEKNDFEQGAGTISTARRYTYTDYQPLSGSNYYRLKQIDNDGRFEYSTIEHVLFKGKEDDMLQVYPNPSSGQFTVDVHNPDNSEAQIRLFDITGKLIWENNFAAGELPKNWKKEFDLPQGKIYIVTIQVGDQVESKKITVLDKY